MTSLVVIARDILAGLTREQFHVRLTDDETDFDGATIVLDAEDGLHAAVAIAGELLRTKPEHVRAALKYELRHALVRLQEMRAA